MPKKHCVVIPFFSPLQVIALARDDVTRKYCSFVKSNEDYGVLAKNILITIADIVADVA